VDVTTHLRARAAQAVGLLALVVGGLAVTPGAALAAQPTVDISSFNPNNVLSGGTVTINYTVTNTNQGGIGGGGDNQANSKVRIDFSGAQCAANDCGQNVTIQPGASQNFVSHVKMPQVNAGQTQQVTVSVTATINGERSNPDSAQITVQGPDKPQSVRAITGKVKDTGGKGVPAARVGAQDSTGKTFQTTTNASGAFSILSNDANPIAPGNIQVGAGKDGFGDGAVVSVQGEAGKTVNVSLTLKPLQASASASASATPSASSASIDPGSVLNTDAPTGPAVNLPSNDAAKNASQNGGSGSMLFVVLGGLLVAAGVGAIVLVLMRRKNANKGGGGVGPDGGDPTALGGGPGMVPPSQGRFNDATRVGGAPVGGVGGPAAATMVAPRSGAPSMSDAPTMLHRPVPAVEDEFPDPYGAPLPQQGGYAGAAAGGWDDQGAGQYGAPNQYPPAEEEYPAAGQYGGGNGQYGGGQYAAPAGQERFDEHTSLYRPESEPDGYAADGGYGQAGGNGQYGGGQYGAAGGGAYGGGAAGGGEYGGQYGGGAYAGSQQEDGYGAGGYQAGGGGYGQEPADQGGYGSWGAPAGGIDSGSGYGPQGDAPGGAHGAAQGQGGSGQYGGGAYGGGGGAAADNGGGAAGGAYGSGGQYGGAGGGGYDDRGGYEQGYDPQQPGGGYGAGNEYGRGNARAPQQPGGAQGHEQYDEDNNGYGGRRGYEDDPQQPIRRGGGGRRPGGY
jgi:hypothetical protein